eukprot:ANDGO_04755.mRNA.1 snRNA-activating protein complex subunit
MHSALSFSPVSEVIKVDSAADHYRRRISTSLLMSVQALSHAPGDIDVSDLCVHSVNEELSALIEREVSESRNRPFGTERDHVPQRKRRDRPYYPNVPLLKLSLRFENVPTKADIGARNRSYALHMAKDAAADDVAEVVGKDHQCAIPSFRRCVEAERKITSASQRRSPLSQFHGSDSLLRNLVLSVVVFHPQKTQKMEEFWVAADQPLTDLADAIHCLTNEIAPPSRFSKFFFIEDVFYSEATAPVEPHTDSTGTEGNPAADDPVVACMRLSSASANHPEWKVKAMHETTFSQLSLRIGATYCFVHNGSCTHHLVFSEIRPFDSRSDFHPYDGDATNAPSRFLASVFYPWRYYQFRIRRRKCNVCDVFSAKFFSENDELSDHSPFFICPRCHDLLHKDADGQLVQSSLKLLPYFHE